MKTFLKEKILGTALEPYVRKMLFTYSRVRGLVDPTYLKRHKNIQYDLQTLEVMKRVLSHHSNGVDVGCYRGTILRELVHFAPHGNHFAFEPIPTLYNELERTWGRLPNLRLYGCALSDAAGTSSFQHVISNPAFSGLQRRQYKHPDENIQEIMVKTDTLDHILPDGVRIDFIKVDVEGAEYQVFRGAVETLKTNKPVVIFEHGLGGADYYGTRPDDIYELLVVQCGLRLFLMGEWLQNGARHPLSANAFSDQFWSAENYYYMAIP
jgi:FkbM family methyltransferase